MTCSKQTTGQVEVFWLSGQTSSSAVSPDHPPTETCYILAELVTIAAIVVRALIITVEIRRPFSQSSVFIHPQNPIVLSDDLGKTLSRKRTDSCGPPPRLDINPPDGKQVQSTSVGRIRPGAIMTCYKRQDECGVVRIDILIEPSTAHHVTRTSGAAQFRARCPRRHVSKRTLPTRYHSSCNVTDSPLQPIRYVGVECAIQASELTSID